jgi:signal transduction histidine kinase
VLPGEAGGHGLVGMRERAMMYGGAFEAGPLQGSGFGVYASWEIP